MPERQSPRRRWSTAVRWPVGVALTSWRYLWRTTPVHRWELTGSWEKDAPPDLPAAVDPSGVQRAEDGVGPLVHRIYRTRVVGSPLSAAELMERITENLDCVAPSEFATFQKVKGDDGALAVGDEYIVRMPGPWDGPVRAVAADARSFRLATLDGHLEAGQIEFRASSNHRSLWFEIESWARSGDRLSDALYTHLRISKEIQLHMWSSVLGKVVDLARARMEGGIVITTRLVAQAALPGERMTESDARIAAEVGALAKREVNFDLSRVAEYRSGTEGWRVDDLVEPLPPEASGPPAEGGSWEVGRRMMDEYQLADPGVVSASYTENRVLPGRDMLLRIRVAGLRFTVGVRVGDVYEETLQLKGRRCHVFGWNYRTLDGHFEEGQMHYEIWKWLDTGDVEFRLWAVSRPARSGPLLARVGFRLFGRASQLRFYQQVCRRARRLTESELETARARKSSAAA